MVFAQGMTFLHNLALDLHLYPDLMTHTQQLFMIHRYRPQSVMFLYCFVSKWTWNEHALENSN